LNNKDVDAYQDLINQAEQEISQRMQQSFMYSLAFLLGENPNNYSIDSPKQVKRLTEIALAKFETFDEQFQKQ